MTTTSLRRRRTRSPAPQQAPNAPLIMHGQYIKDLSFENPRAPQSLIEQTQPQLTLNVQVTNRQFDAKTFEVALSIEASAKTPKDEPLFMLELVYAGTVSLGEVPQEAYRPAAVHRDAAPALPVRPRRRRQRHARGGLPAAQHRAGRFRGALSPAARGQRRQGPRASPTRPIGTRLMAGRAQAQAIQARADR